MINNSHHSSSIIYFYFLVSEFWILIARFCTSHIWILDAAPFVLVRMNSRFYVHQLWILNSTFLQFSVADFSGLYILYYGFWIVVSGWHDSSCTTSGLWIMDSDCWILDLPFLDYGFCYICILLYEFQILFMLIADSEFHCFPIPGCSFFWILLSGLWIMVSGFWFIHFQ